MSPDIWLLAWAIVSVVILVLGVALDPDSISNFTTWVWMLQTLFFILYSMTAFGHGRGDTKLLNTYFLPVLFACEWTTAISVVYMMVVETALFQENQYRYGAATAWIGNFIVHYLTLAILLYYMHTKTDHQKVVPTLDYIHVLGFATFILLFSYIVLFHPNQHYGLPSATDFEVAFSILLAGAFGLATYLAWRTGFQW